RRSLEETAAAEREERVADEGNVFLVEAVGDVAAGVTRYLDDACACRTEFHDVAFADRPVDAGYLVLLALRADHRAARLLLQLRIAARMVEMMVRVQDMRERPAPLFESGEDRLHFRRVDRCGLAARGLVDQVAVIVVQAGKLVDF